MLYEVITFSILPLFLAGTALVVILSPCSPVLVPSNAGLPVNALSGPYWILPSPFLSVHANNPPFSHVLNHEPLFGVPSVCFNSPATNALYSTFCTFLISYNFV